MSKRHGKIWRGITDSTPYSPFRVYSIHVPFIQILDVISFAYLHLFTEYIIKIGLPD